MVCPRTGTWTVTTLQREASASVGPRNTQLPQPRPEFVQSPVQASHFPRFLPGKGETTLPSTGQRKPWSPWTRLSGLQGLQANTGQLSTRTPEVSNSLFDKIKVL